MSGVPTALTEADLVGTFELVREQHRFDGLTCACGVTVEIVRDEEGQPVFNPLIRHHHEQYAAAFLAARVSTATGDTERRLCCDYAPTTGPCPAHDAPPATGLSAAGDDLRDRVAALAEPLCKAICDLLGEPRVLVPGEVSALLQQVLTASPAPVVSRPEATAPTWRDRKGFEIRRRCDGCIDAALAAGTTARPIRPDFHDIDCAASLATDPEAGGDRG